MIKKLLSSFIFFFISQFVFAHPSPVVDKIISESTAKATLLEQPAVATLWGAFHRFKQWTNNQGDVLQIKSPHFRSGEIEIYFSEQKKMAPLFVFMPGIFGRLNKGLTPQMIDRLESMGGHVLVVPNLLSTEYMRAHPLYGSDPFALERQVMDETVSFALTKLGKKVSTVHVLAESLGTAVASAWVAWDREHDKRLSSLTMLWPPLNLAVAMKNFDQIVNDYQKAAESCGMIEKLWVVGREFLMKEYPEKLTPREKECLGVIVLHDGFMRGTKRSWNAHAEADHRKEKEPTSFEDFFQKYRSELWNLIKNQDERTQLAHWMKVIRKDEKFQLRIMTSQNDFLNRHQSWDEFKKKFYMSDDELLILPWGGHSGPIGMKQFTELLKAYSPLGNQDFKSTERSNHE